MESGGSAGICGGARNGVLWCVGAIAVSRCGAMEHQCARKVLWIQRVAGVTRETVLTCGSHVCVDKGSGVREGRSVGRREQS